MGAAPPLAAKDIDTQGVTTSLMSALDVYNPDSTSVKVSAVARAEVRNWLNIIEVFSSYEVRSLSPGPASRRAETVTQPGLRYSQALELMEVLRRDDGFRTLTKSEQALVFETIDTDVLGRMLEEIVIHETDAARGGWEWRPSGEEPDTRFEVFKLTGDVLPSGKPCPYEFDMVTFDHATNTLDLYEIKHSDQVAREQARHLVNDEVVAAVAADYGATEPVGRHVLYRGPSLPDPLGMGVDYINVEEYLMSL